MRTFDEIYAIAADRKGGASELEKGLAKPGPTGKLAKLPEDRWLSILTKGVFQAGFNWKVVDNMWPGFEEAFHGFDIDRCAFMPDDWFDELVADKRIIRNGPKIRTVQGNARMIQDLRSEGGVAKVIADWPLTDQIGLMEMLKTRGSRLGGMTGQYALRFAGKDTFILSRDVTAA